jgi:hypothetical protein
MRRRRRFESRALAEYAAKRLGVVGVCEVNDGL